MQPELFTPSGVEGVWQSIGAGHVLLPLGGDLLVWEPATGAYRVFYEVPTGS
jgi:hypothetical protein